MIDPPPESGTEEIRPPGGAPALVRRFRLTVVAGPDEGARFVATAARTLIGTDRSADFRLHDRTLSRFHCQIDTSTGRAVVHDIDSRNGTLVDGVPVLVAPLGDTAELTLGRTRLRFDLGREHAQAELYDGDRFGMLSGGSPAMRAVYALLDRAAQTEMTVLLEGETGTGKDLAARSIHERSDRSGQPFVVVDCGALAEQLLPSELFGHERGAFTGAEHTRRAAFERASGGTLFLDEIGELPFALQPTLLRVLEAREIRRVGGSQTVPVDVRIIAATNRDLLREVNAGRFRSDLYYRLAVLRIAMPPLRERVEDIPVLAQSIAASVRGRPAAGGGQSGAEADPLTPGFLAKLQRHVWPGNVRELRNHIERCLALEQQGAPASDGPASSQAPPGIAADLPLAVARRRWLDYFERRYLEAVLVGHAGNVTEAARSAGVARSHLHRLLSRHGMR